MQEQFQGLIGLWKTCPQFLKDNELSFEEIHSFHKSYNQHTCKKSFDESFPKFQIQFLNCSTLFSNQLFKPFNRIFKRTNLLASS